VTLNKSRPSTFISYARADALEFVRRIAFALEMYCDIFWDKRIQAGDFPHQLETEICSREYFIFVMSPSSKHSAWCQKELDIALREGKTIVPIRIFDGVESVDEDLKQKYTYADFHEDFEAGFRQLVFMISGEAHSSWEYIGHERDHNLVLSSTFDGKVPALIVRELAEWMISTFARDLIEEYLTEAYPHRRYHIRTQTCEGLKQAISVWKQIAIRENDVILLVLVRDDIEKLVVIVLNEIQSLKEMDHAKMGELFNRLLQQFHKTHQLWAVERNKIEKHIKFDAYFRFEVADYARQLVVQHATKSRYLY
jgi:hypothetical protein